MPRLHKKLVTFWSLSALILMDAWFDLGFGAETRKELILLGAAYMLGQGVADFGKHREPS